MWKFDWKSVKIFRDPFKGSLCASRHSLTLRRQNSFGIINTVVSAAKHVTLVPQPPKPDCFFALTAVRAGVERSENSEVY